jgi:RNA polymerase sigma-70 factor (ECF subfamily)
MTDPAPSTPDSEPTLAKLARARAGDRQAVGGLLAEYRPRLARMVVIRLHPQLRVRVDPEDVVQAGFVEALRRLDEYLADPRMPFFLWVRFLVAQELLALERRHLGTQARDVRREQGRGVAAAPEATSDSLTDLLAASITTPSQGVMRSELKARIESALAAMEPIDREVLVLRQFEQLSNAEAAIALEVDEPAASKRYVRALGRLRSALSRMPGGLDALA